MRNHFNYWARRNPDDFVTYPRPARLSVEEAENLLRSARGGDIAARDRVWLQFLRLTLSVVNRLDIPDRLLDDAIQEGSLAIPRAIQQAQFVDGRAFSTYVWKAIHSAVLRFLAQQGVFFRTPEHLYLRHLRFRSQLNRSVSARDARGVWDSWRERNPKLFHLILRPYLAAECRSLEELGPTEQPVADDTFYDDSPPLKALVRRVLRTLDPRERDVVSRVHGLLGRRIATVSEVARSLGLTGERVRQILKVARRRIRKRLRACRTYIPVADEDDPLILPRVSAARSGSAG